MDENKNKTAEVAGGVAGAATAVGIGAAGVGASASTITYTLAAIGGAVGGGMAAGLAIIAAAPLAIGAAGYGTVKLIQKVNKKKKK